MARLVEYRSNNSNLWFAWGLALVFVDSKPHLHYYWVNISIKLLDTLYIKNTLVEA